MHSLFWKTPGGILTIIFISVFVAGGLIAGLIYAFSGNSDDYTKSIQSEWARLNEAADKVDSEMGPVENLESIGSAAQVHSFRELLDESDDGLDDIISNIKSLSPPGDRPGTRDILLETAEPYQRYLNELGKFLDKYSADAQDPRLDSILDDMSDLSGTVRDSGEDFTRLTPGITPASFDPEVLRLSSDYSVQLGAVRKQQADKEQRETGQETVEAVNYASDSLEKILAIYVGKGWDDMVPYMTQSLYTKYEEADPPWDQVSYTVKTADITNFQVEDENKIVFTVKEQHDEGEEVTTETGNWEMVKTGNNWLLNNTPYAYN